MTCVKCGATGIAETATFCACGFAFREPEAPAGYAPFWRRLAAFWIDNMVITLPVIALMFYWYPPTEAEMRMLLYEPFSTDPLAWTATWTRMAGVLPFAFLLMVLYHTAMNCTRWQGSCGKRAMRLRVVDGGNRPLALPQSALREGARVLSALPVNLGYLWILWEPRKRSFHDMIAGTFVVEDAVWRGERARGLPPPLPH